MFQFNQKFIHIITIIFFVILFTVTTRHAMVLGIQQTLTNYGLNSINNRIFIYFILAVICALVLFNMGAINLILPEEDTSKTWGQHMKYITTFLVFLLYGVASWNTIDNLLHLFIEKTGYNKLVVYSVVSIGTLLYLIINKEVHLILG